MQLLRELQPEHFTMIRRSTLGLNEVQFPKELQLGADEDEYVTADTRLNEVQFPKELQPST